MTNLDLYNFFLYFIALWAPNISLNIFYLIKTKIPKFLLFDKPLDLGLMYKGNRVLGKSTTIIGLVLVLCMSAGISFFVSGEDTFFMAIPILVYFGHATGSFIKRRFGKKDGEFLSFVDHGDYVIFTGIILFVFKEITLLVFVLSVLLTYLLHPIACRIAYHLGFRENPF